MISLELCVGEELLTLFLGVFTNADQFGLELFLGFRMVGFQRFLPRDQLGQLLFVLSLLDLDLGLGRRDQRRCLGSRLGLHLGDLVDRAPQHIRHPLLHRVRRGRGFREQGDLFPQPGRFIAEFLQPGPQALDVVEQQLLLGGQHLDVGIDRGRIVASEPTSERVRGFGFHYQLPF